MMKQKMNDYAKKKFLEIARQQIETLADLHLEIRKISEKTDDESIKLAYRLNRVLHDLTDNQRRMRSIIVGD